MANVVQTVEVKITGDNANVKKSADDAGKSIQKMGPISAKTGKIMAAGIAAGAAAFSAMIKSATAAFADYEQLVGGVDTLFKKSSQTVQKYAANAYKTAGLSANQYMETVTSFSASLLQGLKGDTKTAAKIADTAITDMADNANKMGTSIEMIQSAYQGFAKDNYTMLDNLKLGYGGTASEMARLVNDSGVMGESFKATAENVKDIPFDQLISAIHTVQTEMGITGTTAKEASNTISGSMNSMKSAWQNLLVAFASGKNVDEAFSTLLDSAKTFGKNLLPVIGKAFQSIVKLAAGIGKDIAKALWDGFKTLPDWLEPIAVGVGIIVAAFTAWKVAITAWSMVTKAALAIQVLFNTVMSANPIMLIVIALAAVTGAIAYAWNQFDGFRNFIMGVVNSVAGFFNGLWNGIKNTFSAVGKWFGNIFNGAVTAIKNAFSTVVGFFQGIWNGITGIFDKVKTFFINVGKGIGNAVGDAIKAVINTVLGFVGGIVNVFIKAINGAISLLNKIPGVNINKLTEVNWQMKAQGGMVSGPGTSTSDSIPTMLSDGEYVMRASAVSRLGSGIMDYINRTGQLPASAGGGAQNVFNINAPQNADYMALSQQIGQRAQFTNARPGMA